MKVSKISVLIFLFALSIGCSIGFLTNLLKTKNQSEINLISPQQLPIEQLSERINNNSKDEFKPKVFEVEGFWDDSLKNQINKNLIELGEVSNGEEFKIKSGETWLGLYGDNKNTKLISTKIYVKKTNGSDLDWTEFSTKTKEKPIFLVKNLKSVKQGKVKTLFRGNSWRQFDKEDKPLTTLEIGFKKEFNLGGQQYILRTDEGFNEKNETIRVLILETENQSQVIYYSEGSGGYLGHLYWVGDLDSDNKPDLFMDLGDDEKGSYTSGIFISSEAEEGKLVKLFEYFWLGGC